LNHFVDHLVSSFEENEMNVMELLNLYNVELQVHVHENLVVLNEDIISFKINFFSYVYYKFPLDHLDY
jgi:hypothetical protein